MQQGDLAATPGEQVFFSSQDVLITRARVVVKGHTYAVRAITSVAADHSGQSKDGMFRRGFMWTLASFGAPFILAAVAGANLGMGELFVGLVLSLGLSCLGWMMLHRYWLRTRRSHLVLRTSSGEVRGMAHPDPAVIEMLSGHISQALASPQ
jgi:hypothetical protein